MKYVFFAKIWFVKTSTRIEKYESRVVKSNPTDGVYFWRMEIKMINNCDVFIKLTFSALKEQNQ